MNNNQNQGQGMQGQQNGMSQGNGGQSFANNANFASTGQPIPYGQVNQGVQGQNGQLGTPSIPQARTRGGDSAGFDNSGQSNGQQYVSFDHSNDGQGMYSGQSFDQNNQGMSQGMGGQRNTGINNADDRNVGYQGGYTGYDQNGQVAQEGTFLRDGTQYGAGPHTIDPNLYHIVAVHNEGRRIAAVQFQDGQVVDIATAIALAEQGTIEDVNTGRNRSGEKTLRSFPDGDPSNNLRNLPKF